MIASEDACDTAIQTRHSTSQHDTQPAWQDRFLQMLPDILKHAGFLLRSLKSAARKEALDEVCALALVAYARLVELGTEELAYVTPLAKFAVAQYRVGRRVGVRLNCRDPLSPYCQRRNGLQLARLNHHDRVANSWQEIVAEDQRFGPADAAAMRLDFKAWLKSLTTRNRRVAEKLATGESTRSTARQFGLSPGRISQLRRELCEAWHLFQDEPSAHNGVN